MDLQRLSSRLDWPDRKWFDLIDHFDHWEIREIQRAGVDRDGRSYGRDANGNARAEQTRLLEAELLFRATLGPEGIAHLQAVRAGRSNDQRPAEGAGQILTATYQGPHQNRESMHRLFVRFTEPESLDPFIRKIHSERARAQAAQNITRNLSPVTAQCSGCGAEIPPGGSHRCAPRATQSNLQTAPFTREAFEANLDLWRQIEQRAITPDQLADRLGNATFPRYIAAQEPIQINIQSQIYGEPRAIRAAIMLIAARARMASNRQIGAGFQRFEAHVKALHKKMRDTLPDGKPVLKQFRKLEMD